MVGPPGFEPGITRVLALRGFLSSVAPYGVPSRASVGPRGHVDDASVLFKFFLLVLLVKFHMVNIL